MLQAKQLEHPIRRRGKPGVRTPEQPGDAAADVLLSGQDEVLPRRKLREYLQQLERAGDAEAAERNRRHPRNVPPVEQHLAGAGRQLAEQAVEERGFARAIGADHAQNFAFLNLEGHSVHRPHAAEMFVQLARFEHHGHGVGSVGAAAGRSRRNSRSASPTSPSGQSASSKTTSTP